MRQWISMEKMDKKTEIEEVKKASFEIHEYKSNTDYLQNAYSGSGVTDRDNISPRRDGDILYFVDNGLTKGFSRTEDAGAVDH